MNTRGYSLIETVTVLLILGVLAAAAAVPFVRPSEKAALERGVWEVQARLNYARFKSVYRGRPMKVTFRGGSCLVDHFDETADEWVREEEHPLPGVTVRANNAPIFHPTGTVSNLATITVSNARGTYRITLAISGRVRATRVA
jgi:prepilin-type N-terminal cleavage/methylation domain-containing protein